MQLKLGITLFSGALGETRLPEITAERPYQAGLLLSGHSDPVGIEMIEILEATGQVRRVLSRTLDPDVKAIAEGAEFFLTRSGKMLGKGTVEKVGI